MRSNMYSRSARGSIDMSPRTAMAVGEPLPPLNLLMRPPKRNMFSIFLSHTRRPLPLDFCNTLLLRSRRSICQRSYVPSYDTM